MCIFFFFYLYYIIFIFHLIFFFFFFFNDPATTEIYTSVNTLSLHDALPIYMTDVVARHPLPQRLEQASLAQPADRRNARLTAPPRLCHRAAEPHRHERRVRHRVPRESDPLSLPAEPERARAVCDHRSSPLAAPTYRHHGKRLAGLAAWADRHA